VGVAFGTILDRPYKAGRIKLQFRAEGSKASTENESAMRLEEQLRTSEYVNVRRNECLFKTMFRD